MRINFVLIYSQLLLSSPTKDGIHDEALNPLDTNIESEYNGPFFNRGFP